MIIPQTPNMLADHSNLNLYTHKKGAADIVVTTQATYAFQNSHAISGLHALTVMFFMYNTFYAFCCNRQYRNIA